MNCSEDRSLQPRQDHCWRRVSPSKPRSSFVEESWCVHLALTSPLCASSSVSALCPLSLENWVTHKHCRYICAISSHKELKSGWDNRVHELQLHPRKDSLYFLFYSTNDNKATKKFEFSVQRICFIRTTAFFTLHIDGISKRYSHLSNTRLW